MNRVLIYENENIDNGKNKTFLISDKNRLEHLINIVKVKCDDEIKVTIIDNGMSMAIIKELTKDHMILVLTQETQKHIGNIDLIIGLSRPPTLKKILEHATTMGSNSFHFYKAVLSEKSYLQSKIFKEENVKTLFEYGLSQSGRYCQLPKLELTKYNPAENFSSYKQKFVLSLRENKTFLDYQNITNFNSPILIAFGPERGFTPDEEDHFIKNGFRPVSLGASILRVEHAVFSTLSQIELLKSAGVKS